MLRSYCSALTPLPPPEGERTGERGPSRQDSLALEPWQRGRLGDVDLDPRNRNSHVVRGAELAAASDDALNRLVEIGVLEKAAHLVDAHARGLHAVAAEHHRVALFDLHLVGERLDRFPHADRARESMLERMALGLLRLDHAKPHLLGRP